MKRMLCWMLMLALVCALAVPCLAADAEGFTDQGEIRNDDAVQMLVKLGLIAGYEDGSFQPGAKITREEVSKLIAILCTENPVAETEIVFADSRNSWAKDYISYCAWRGIVCGDGVYFRPKDNVTAQELAKMLLVVLGEDSERYQGAAWADNVNTDAQTRGIYDGLNTEVKSAVTRDNACLLIYNAMRCFVVADPHSEDPMQHYVLDDLMNPRTYLEVRYDVVRYNGILTGNDCADLTGTDKLEPGQTRLAGHKPFNVSTDLSLVGRSVDIYMRDGEIIGAPCHAAGENYYALREISELQGIRMGGYMLTDETEYYYNFVKAGAEILQSCSENAKVIVIDHDGDCCFDTVLVISCTAAVVSSLSPLTVTAGSRELEVQAFDSSDLFAEGQEVQLFTVGGTGYIRPVK